MAITLFVHLEGERGERACRHRGNGRLYRRHGGGGAAAHSSRHQGEGSQGRTSVRESRHGTRALQKTRQVQVRKVLFIEICSGSERQRNVNPCFMIRIFETKFV